jgi:hypothetical protein
MNRNSVVSISLRLVPTATVALGPEVDLENEASVGRALLEARFPAGEIGELLDALVERAREGRSPYRALNAASNAHS